MKTSIVHGAMCEALEGRQLLSVAPHVKALPAQDASKVAAAFHSFDTTYFSDVKTILFASGATPAANRPAFDQAVSNALGSLNTSIDADITNLPTEATLATTIQGELIGTDPSTLQSKLAALATPKGPGTASALAFRVASAKDIAATSSKVVHQVATAPPPVGTIPGTQVKQDLAAINSAFAAFKMTDSTDIKTVLLTGNVSPATNRPTFDADISAAITTLNASADAAISNLPASVASSLTSTIDDDLLGSSSTSLVNRLAAISTPNTGGVLPAFAFRMASGLIISAVQAQVDSAVVGAIRQYNASL